MKVNIIQQYEIRAIVQEVIEKRFIEIDKLTTELKVMLIDCNKLIKKLEKNE